MRYFAVNRVAVASEPFRVAKNRCPHPFYGGDRISTTLRWVLALTGLNFLNLVYTQNIFYTRQTVILNLSVLFIFWVAKQEIKTDRRRAILCWIIMVSGLLVSAEAFCQQLLGKGILGFWSNLPVGTIGNTNYLGCYLLFPIFASIALFSNPRTCRHVRFGIIPSSFLLLVSALVLSRARASWLGFGVGFTLWVFLTVPRKTFIVVALLGSLGMLVAILWFPHVAKDWTETNTLGYRAKYWRASIELSKQNPMFGTGFGSYRNLVYAAQAKLGQKDPDFWKGYVAPKPRHVHNDYLESLNDGGLLYAVTFWGFIFWILRNSFRKGSNRAQVAIWCGLIAILVSALFFFPMRLVDTYALFFVQLGALCSESS